MVTLLFEAPLIEGLRYEEGILSEAEEQAPIMRLKSAGLEPLRFHGWLGNRKTHSFGWRYDFDDGSFAPTEPMPAWLEPLRETSAAFAGVEAGEFVHVLLARYDPGAGIGWHRDRDVFDKVVGVSLGAPTTLRFRRRTSGGFQRANLGVLPRSAYLLSGPSRWDWEHSIAPGDGLRFSITFRTLSDKGRRFAAK